MGSQLWLERSYLRPVLHVITDETIQSSFTHAKLAELASANGADFVQFREKRQLKAKKLYSVARKVLEVCVRSEQTQLIVNDRVHIAYAIGARAVHLGKNDLPISVAREILGPDGYIGGTANSLEEASQLSDQSLDYLGVGPVFGTASKANPAPKLGLENFSRICSESSRPVIAIGNIQLENVPDVIEAGAAGIAVLSAVVNSDNPGRATYEFVRALESVS